MEYWQGFGSDGLESLMMFSFSNSDDFVSKIRNSSNSNWYDVWTVCISCKYDKNIFTGEVMTATFQFQWRIMVQFHLEVFQESLHPVLNSQLVQMRNLVIEREITTLCYIMCIIYLMDTIHIAIKSLLQTNVKRGVKISLEDLTEPPVPVWHHI